MELVFWVVIAMVAVLESLKSLHRWRQRRRWSSHASLKRPIRYLSDLH